MTGQGVLLNPHMVILRDEDSNLDLPVQSRASLPIGPSRISASPQE